MNPYEVLGVPVGSDKKTVKKAYIELTKKYHPDQYVNHPLANLAEEKMKAINAAYDAIMNGTSYEGGGQSDNNRSSSDYSYTRSTYSGSSNSGDNAIFRKVAELISRGSLDEAEQLLETATDRGAEYCYLRGSIAAQRGWHDEAIRYFRMAVEQNPTDFRYRSALNNMLKRNNAYQSDSNAFGYQGRARTDGLCECCTTLMCMDCLCHSCGGC